MRLKWSHESEPDPTGLAPSWEEEIRTRHTQMETQGGDGRASTGERPQEEPALTLGSGTSGLDLVRELAGEAGGDLQRKASLKHEGGGPRSERRQGFPKAVGLTSGSQGDLCEGNTGCVRGTGGT